MNAGANGGRSARAFFVTRVVRTAYPADDQIAFGAVRSNRDHAVAVGGRELRGGTGCQISVFGTAEAGVYFSCGLARSISRANLLGCPAFFNDLSIGGVRWAWRGSHFLVGPES